ncbi:hypothetical protein LJB89_00765 [Tyzzerella sp. OttesenSCG-928-J15]|nr:hypothetical protein [Tyzzerella sp. OttesenSCG-928-J15]
MELNIIDKYEIFIYEAAFIAVESNFWNGGHIPQALRKAIERILAAANILNLNTAKEYLESHYSIANSESAKNLLEQMNKADRPEFFKSLTYDQLILYHSANFDISSEYGEYIANLIDFEGKNIVDIGGSSGGLLHGVKSRCNTADCTVFDTSAACLAGESFATGINYVERDFWTSDFSKYSFDIGILSNILHDWSDEACIKLLSNLRPALANAEHIIIHEDILAEGGASPVETLMYGLRLSINEPGGKQRDIGEITALISESLPMFSLHKLHRFGPLSAAVFKSK